MIQTMPISIAKRSRTASLRLASAAALLTLSACAAAPMPPTAALQAAELAIADAEKARVADYASPELGEAREKLTAARSAVEKGRMVAAWYLAEESRADAELASAKAEMTKAKQNRHVETIIVNTVTSAR